MALCRCLSNDTSAARRMTRSCLPRTVVLSPLSQNPTPAVATGPVNNGLTVVYAGSSSNLVEQSPINQSKPRLLCELLRGPLMQCLGSNCYRALVSHLANRSRWPPTRPLHRTHLAQTPWGLGMCPQPLLGSASLSAGCAPAFFLEFFDLRCARRIIASLEFGRCPQNAGKKQFPVRYGPPRNLPRQNGSGGPTANNLDLRLGVSTPDPRGASVAKRFHA